MATTQYLLPPWIHVCFTGDGTIFLDLKNDRYSGLNEQDTATLRRALDDAEGLSSAAHDLASSLVERGLLTNDPTCSRPFAATSFARPTAVLFEDGFGQPPPIKLRDVATFTAACITVMMRLRGTSLQRTITRLGERPERWRNLPRPSLEECRRLMRVLAYLRTFVYVARDRCLQDSLITVDFLRRNGVYARCVFGVSTLPFAAHCWPQIEEYVTTHHALEWCLRFEPILAA